jgi:hypothetical protein
MNRQPNQLTNTSANPIRGLTQIGTFMLSRHIPDHQRAISEAFDCIVHTVVVDLLIFTVVVAQGLFPLDGWDWEAIGFALDYYCVADYCTFVGRFDRPARGDWFD